mmetsp:Transcript_11952/g.36003  ORF Transcript_11952/g.36003 Transcript_11952/m.36003 type:complete len:222 (-) Transcript_11952:428-1093(-)
MHTSVASSKAFFSTAPASRSKVFVVLCSCCWRRILRVSLTSLLSIFSLTPERADCHPSQKRTSCSALPGELPDRASRLWLVIFLISRLHLSTPLDKESTTCSSPKSRPLNSSTLMSAFSCTAARIAGCGTRLTSGSAVSCCSCVSLRTSRFRGSISTSFAALVSPSFLSRTNSSAFSMYGLSASFTREARASSGAPSWNVTSRTCEHSCSKFGAAISTVMG